MLTLRICYIIKKASYNALTLTLSNFDNLKIPFKGQEQEKMSTCVYIWIDYVCSLTYGVGFYDLLVLTGWAVEGLKVWERVVSSPTLFFCRFGSLGV